LKEFVKDGIKWAHIDLAGPVFNSKRWAYNPAGATGFAVRTMLNFITGR
jgi:leucyl aminopeptidase